MNKYLILLVVVAITPMMFAGESNIEVIFGSKENITIPTGENPAYKGVTLPAVTVPKGKVIAIAFTGWFNIDGGGWCTLGALKINGKNVPPDTQQGKARLLNRPGKLKTTLGDKPWWNLNSNANVYLITMFYGGKNKVDPRVIFPREEEHRYLLDITDLLNTQGTNTVEFGNYLTFNICKDKIQRPLMVENIQLVAIDAKDVAVMRGEVKSSQTIKINPCVTTPKINGIIESVEWQNSETCELKNMRGGKGKNSTLVYTAYDQDNLYIAVQCNDKNTAKIKCAFDHVEEHDNSIWQDENIDISIMPYGDGDLFKIIVNAAGVTYDDYNNNTAWESQLKSAVSKKQDSWMVEMAIPFASLGFFPKGGEEWKINIGRLSQNTGELSSIVSGAGGFADNLATAKFEKNADFILKSLSANCKTTMAFLKNGEYQIELVAKNMDNKVFNTTEKIKINSEASKEIIISYPSIQKLSELTLKVKNEDESVIYENTIKKPTAIKTLFRTWKVADPLYEELILPGGRATSFTLNWASDIEPIRLRQAHALQYGFKYNRDDIYKYLVQQNALVIANSRTTIPNGDKNGVLCATHPLYRFAKTAVSPETQRPFLHDPIAQDYYLKDLEKIFTLPNTGAVYMGDELIDKAIVTAIDLFKNQRQTYPFINQFDAAVKSTYGGNKWGIPDSLHDNSAGRWMAFHRYLNDKHAQLMKDAYQLIKKSSPTTPFVADDPVDGSNAADYATWRGAFDIATCQLYPNGNPESCGFAYNVKRLKDLSGAKLIMPCAHIERYAGNWTLEETLAMLSQAVRGGANGWHYYPEDSVGLRGGKNYMITEYFGAPDRELLFRTVAAVTPNLKYPVADCAFFSSQDTAWSAYLRRPNKEIAAFTMLGPGVGLWFDIINETIAESNDLSKYKVIFVADACYERDAAIEALEKYVSNGGKLVILDSQAFSKNNLDNDLSLRREKLFGVKGTGRLPDNLNFIYQLNSYPAGSAALKLHTSSAQVIIKFDDGSSAVTVNDLGKGKIYYFAFNPATSKELRPFMKKFAADLGLQIDQKIWRFAFPESLIKKLPEPEGLCVTNNHILWRLFEPLTSWNEEVKGTYLYSRKPDFVEDKKNINNIPFDKGNLTNRIQALKAGNVSQEKSKIEDWIVSFSTKTPMTITFELDKSIPLNRIELFYQGSLPAITAEISIDGKTWSKFNFKSILSDNDSINQQTLNFDEQAVKTIKLTFETGDYKDSRLTLSEVEIWKK